MPRENAFQAVANRGWENSGGLIAVIGLLDLYGAPLSFPPNLTTDAKYTWAKTELEHRVGECCPLWIAPASSGAGRKLTRFRVNGAAWSPDGKMLAYASGGDLYLANRDGTAPHRITMLPGTVDALCWSPDCKRLRLAIEERKAKESNRLWEVQLDHPTARRVLPGWSRAPHDYERPGRWTPNGEFFVFAAVHDGTPGLFAIRERRTFFDMGTPAPIRLTTSMEAVYAPTPSPDGKKIYAIIDSPLRGELTRLEPKSGQPVVWPGMPGLSAGHVAFSPDGHEAAYVTYQIGRAHV